MGRGTTLRARGISGATGRLLSLVSTVLVATLTVLGLLAPVASALPVADDTFAYDYVTRVSHGTGWYSGYKDVMNSHSEYKVIRVEGPNVTIASTGSWTYDDNEGMHESGSNDMVFRFDVETRTYLGVTDVEDEGYVDPIVWFWINPVDLTEGSVVPILDDIFEVTDTGKTIWVGGLPREVAVLVSVGTYARNDEYGQFEASYEDIYYFDKTSGYIVAEKYVEEDSNYEATFRFTAEVTVTSSTYDLPVSWMMIAIVYGGVPAVIAAIGLMIMVIRRGPSTIRVATADGVATVKLSKVRKPSDVEYLTPGGTRYFAPFLPVFVRRALEQRDPVLIARSGQGLMGTAVFDRESGIGSIFAVDESVARALRRRLRLREFFVELDGGNWDMSPAGKIGDFDVLELQGPKPQRYDSMRVKAMRREHLDEVAELAMQVYRGRAYQWVRSSFDGGDIGFVALDSFRVIGFGFATVAGTDARLHMLTVAPEYRSRGLGTEIMAARLSTLSALGVGKVIVEISEHNVASMRVATKAGFSKVGRTAYYSKNRAGPPEEVFQRRM